MGIRIKLVGLRMSFVLVCLSIARCNPDRCPDFSSGSRFSYSGLGSGSGSASASSGSGLAISCDELRYSEEGDYFRALNYYCRSVYSPPPDCGTLECRFCEELVACDVPSSSYDVCASDLPLSCSLQSDVPLPGDLYSRVCSYVSSLCFGSPYTGICASRTLRDTCYNVTNLSYPCDCFLPSATCDLCMEVVPLCQDVDGRCPDFSSGISYSASGSGFGSAFGSGSGLSISCDELEPDSEERDIFLALNYYCSNVYRPSPDCRTIACRICEELVACDVLSSLYDVCASDFPLYCSVQPELPFLGDLYSGVCSYVSYVCFNSRYTGICESRTLLQTCSNITDLYPYPCDCFLPNATCNLCAVVSPLCQDIDNRCPDFSSGVLYYDSGSGSGSGFNSGFGSGSGLDISCDDLANAEPGDYFQALNYYCSNFYIPPPDCGSIACRICEELVACDVPSSPYDVCASDLPLSCSVRPEIPFLGDLYSGVCSYVSYVCFNSRYTGICESRTLLQTCSNITDLDPYPCDCFLPNATCNLCADVSPLCQDIDNRCPDFSSGVLYYDSGSGSGSGFNSGFGSGSGLGISCDDLANAEPGDYFQALNYYCSNFYILPPDCGSIACRICEELVACDVPSSSYDVCASDLPLSCSVQPEIPFLGDLYSGVCSYVSNECFYSRYTGICESRTLLQTCSNITDQYPYPCDCFLPNATCNLCAVVSPLCQDIDNRCPDFSSGVSYYDSGSGSGSGFNSGFGSGSGLGISCDDLANAEPGDYFQALNYYCSNIYILPPDCESIACRICEELVTCNVPSSPYDVCTSDLPLSCSVQPEIPFLSDLYSGVCSYVSYVCFNSRYTGICESRTLLQTCSNITDLYPYPCDCFLPNATCNLCADVLPLCSRFISCDGSGSGSGSGSSYSGSGVYSGSGSICTDIGSYTGLLYFCLSFITPGVCSSSSGFLCETCQAVFSCPNLTLPTQTDVCSNSVNIIPCFCSSGKYSQYCSVIIPLCFTSDSGLCDADEVISNCTELVNYGYGPCTDRAAEEICSTCTTVLELCMLGPSTTTAPSSTTAVTAVPPSPSTTTTRSATTERPVSSTTISTTTEPSVPSTATSTTAEPPAPSGTVSPTTVSPTTEPPSSSTSIQIPSSSEPSVVPSPSPGPSEFPEGTTIEVDKLDEEQADNTVNIEIGGITVAQFLEKELAFRESVATAINKANTGRRRKRNDEELTADDVKYVGMPITTDDGFLVVAFFAQFPDGPVVDGGQLAEAVNDNSDDISAATGGTVREVKTGIPDALQPPGTASPDSDDSSGEGLSGGEIAAIVVVLLVVAAVVAIVVVGVVVKMRRKRRRFELITSADDYRSIGGTYETDTFTHEGAKSRSGSAPLAMKDASNVYTPVPTKDTTLTNTGAVEDAGAMKEDEEPDRSDAPEKEDHLGESSKDTHL